MNSGLTEDIRFGSTRPRPTSLQPSLLPGREAEDGILFRIFLPSPVLSAEGIFLSC